MSTMNRPPQPDAIKEVMLPHVFTCEEMLKLASEQNMAWACIEKLERDRVDMAVKIDRAIKAEKEIISKNAAKLQAGREPRPTKVVVAYDPTAGTKTYYSTDDPEKATPLQTLRMEKADYVLELPMT